MSRPGRNRCSRGGPGRVFPPAREYVAGADLSPIGARQGTTKSRSWHAVRRRIGRAHEECRPEWIGYSRWSDIGRKQVPILVGMSALNVSRSEAGGGTRRPNLPPASRQWVSSVRRTYSGLPSNYEHGDLKDGTVGKTGGLCVDTDHPRIESA